MSYAFFSTSDLSEGPQHTVNDYVDSAFDGDPDQETLRGCLHALVAAREAPMEILELGNVWLALKERFKSAAGGFGDRSAPDRVARLHVRLEPLEILATSWMARAQEAVLTTTLSQR